VTEAEIDAGTRGHANAWLALGAMAGAAGFVAWGLARPASAPSVTECDALAAETAEVVPEGATGQIREAFAATGLPYASTTAHTVARDLDRYATHWRAAIRQVCDESEGAIETDDRAACLRRHRQQLAAILEVLGAADATVVERAWRTAWIVPPIEDCGGQLQRPADDAQEDPALDRIAAVIALGHGDEVAEEIANRLSRSGEGSDPERARTLLLGGRVHLDRGELDEAAPLLEQAVWSSLEVGDDPGAIDAALDLAACLGRAGSDPMDAQRWWRLASAITTRGHAGLTRQARLLNAQADLAFLQGQWEAALLVYQPALGLMERTLGPEHPALAGPLAQAAEAAARLGRPGQSMKLYDRARQAVAKGLGRHHPSHRALARRHGEALLDAGRPDLARPELEAALSEPDAAPTLDDARTALALGRAAVATGDLDAAEGAFDRALSIHHAIGAPVPTELAAVHLARGMLRVQTGDPASALESLHQALELQAGPEGTHTPATIQTSIRIGRTLARLGRLPEARQTIDEAAAAAASVYGPRDPRTADVWLDRADVLAETGDPSAALEVSRHALAVLAEARGPTDPSTIVALTRIGSLCLALDRDADAVAAYREAVAAAAAAGRPTDELASAGLGLATALWRQGEHDEALAWLARVRETVGELGAASSVTAADLRNWMERRGLSM
jgi:eukaryotic-like serine/threonine-protein kinase